MKISNVRGVLEKKWLDPRKNDQIKEVVFQIYHCGTREEPHSIWRACHPRIPGICIVLQDTAMQQGTSQDHPGIVRMLSIPESIVLPCNRVHQGSSWIPGILSILGSLCQVICELHSCLQSHPCCRVSRFPSCALVPVSFHLCLESRPLPL